MKFHSAFLLLGSILGANAAAFVEEPTVEMKIRASELHAVARDLSLAERAAEVDGTVLTKRACKENGCKCKKGTPQGQYCGMCSEVIGQGKGGNFAEDIYECNKQGGCCDYGYNKNCAKNKLTCG